MIPLLEHQPDNRELKMKIGIIGLGDIAQKAYLPHITHYPNIELVLCTRSVGVLKQLSAQYRVAQVCSDFTELAKFNVDAVMIHSATSAHPMIAEYFVNLGIPTFVDKPLADSAHQVEQLYDLAEKSSTPLYVGFNRRHIPLFNQHIPELIRGKIGDLKSLRWEKNRFNMPGDLRTFVFDDFIHPLDSVNLNAQASLQDVWLTTQRERGKIARIDVQWQSGETLLHASMNRQFGITNERVSATYHNKALEFESFYSGKVWQENNQQQLLLKDWTPMLASKGFHAMFEQWLQVIETGDMPSTMIDRNIASHQLAEAICQKISTVM